MKKGKKLLALLAGSVMGATMVFGFAACGDNNGDNPDDGKNPGGNTGKATAITVWVSETAGVKTLTEKQIKAFMEANPDYKDKYNITVDGISESEAATKMTTDVATGADIFCFAQDQLGRLVEAKALSKLGVKATEFVNDNNDGGAARAAYAGSDMYAYPITSDNGYFMYYDKSVISDEAHLDDLESIVADCAAANKKFAFELEGSAWYTASFFFGAGCTSNWSFDNKENKWAVADDFNSAKGIIAMKGMQILTKSSVYVNSSKAAEFGEAFTDDDGNAHDGGAAVVVSGTWDSGTAKEKLGDNLGVAKLPKFKVDGKSYQLGSYSGNKLMGVKPHTDTTVQAFCHALAQHLSGKDAQEDRFDEFGWGPSNKEVQAMDKVTSDECLAALNAQNEFATPQGNINGGWWDFAKLLGKASKEAADDAALQAALDSYKASLDKYTSMTVDAMNAFGVIGKIVSLEGTTENLSETQTAWAEWGADYKMEKSEKDGKIIWKTVAKITLTEGDKLQVRKGQQWDEQYGALGDDGHSTKDNFEITADNAGTKYVVLTLTVDKDGNVQYGVVTLED